MLADPIECCGVCKSERSVALLECTRDLNAQFTEVKQCRHCLAIFNGRAYSLLNEATELKDIQRTDFYVPENKSLETLLNSVKEKGALLNYLFAKFSRDWRKSVFCDFGGGDGLVAIAASDVFQSSVLCDMDTRSVHEVCRAVGYPENLDIINNLSEVGQPIDVMFMWHVLEHIPEPADFLENIKPFLSSNCIFFIQCPAYRKEYLVDCHYTLFNRPSFEALFGLLGISLIEVSFDLENSFITALGFLGDQSA